MTIQTKLFGEIGVNEEKKIHFDNGIIGFPELKNYLIIYDEEQGDKGKISWLQSIEEPAFAMPVMNPLLIKTDYNPTVDDELIKPVGELDAEEMLVLVTVTIPTQLENISVNLKAPIVINAKTKKACQIVVENEEYSVKYPVYEILKTQQEKAGE